METFKKCCICNRILKNRNKFFCSKKCKIEDLMKKKIDTLLWLCFDFIKFKSYKKECKKKYNDKYNKKCQK